MTRAFLLMLAVVVAGCQDDMPTSKPVSRKGLGMAETTLLLSAERAVERQQFQYASTLIDSLNRVVPNLPETQFIAARVQSGVGNASAAESTYADLLRHGFERRGVRQNAGEAAFKQNQFNRALEYFRVEFAMYPSALPLHGMGMAFERLGQPDSARFAFERSLEEDPSYAPAERSLAAGYEQEGEFDKAIVHIERALQLDPSNEEFRSTHGILLSRAGSDSEAVHVLSSVIASNPADYAAEIALGRSLQRLGRDTEASHHLKLGEQKRAALSEVERLRVAVQGLPESDRLRVGLAQNLQRVGLFDEAIRNYQILEYRLPGNLTVSGNLATLYMQAGDTTEALRRYRRILSQDSTHVETWLNLGHYYARDGRRREALNAWGKAARYGPEHPGVKALERMAQGN